MTANFLWDVFLSHSSRDKARVRALGEHLREAGLRVWLDEWVIQPGDDIYAAVEYGLEYTRTLILCISQAALNSDWVKLERNTTLFRDPQNSERRFIPLLLEDCDCPAVIRRLKRFDWRDGNVDRLEELIQICRSTRRKRQLKASSLPPTPPSGVMNARNPLYIEREADIYVIAAAHQRAETIIIKAPRQMGKSSLLLRYLSACRGLGKKTVLIDLASLCSSEDMLNYSTFLTLLAGEMWEQIGQNADKQPPRIDRQNELTKYVHRALLSHTDENVVFAFDEMDRVLGRNYQADFFSMLRFWHNQRADSATNWHKLGLAIAISTEPFLFIDDALRSPFNVGLNIELRLFNKHECQKLNRLYRAGLNASEIDRLMLLLNGHPHLTHLAFYALTGPNSISFPALLQTASFTNGPFSAHLRALEFRLIDDAGQGLIRSMKQVVNDGRVSRKGDSYRLHAAGLICLDGTRLSPSNELYARFFRDL